MMPARHLSVSIDRPFDEVYDYAHRPENYTKWTEGLCTALHPHPGGTWVAEMPVGNITMSFTPPNGFGILDYTVFLPIGAMTVPMRLVRNGNGVEVIMTLFRYEEQSDAEFANDLMSAMRDLEKLKKLMEPDNSSVVHVNFPNKRK